MCLLHRLWRHNSTFDLTVNYLFFTTLISSQLRNKKPSKPLGLEGHHMQGSKILLCVVTLL